jgi:hypothetical protein
MRLLLPFILGTAIIFAAAPASAFGTKAKKPPQTTSTITQSTPPPTVKQQIKQGKIINPNANKDLEDASKGGAK